MGFAGDGWRPLRLFRTQLVETWRLDGKPGVNAPILLGNRHQQSRLVVHSVGSRCGDWLERTVERSEDSVDKVRGHQMVSAAKLCDAKSSV